MQIFECWLYNGVRTKTYKKTKKKKITSLSKVIDILRFMGIINKLAAKLTYNRYSSRRKPFNMVRYVI